jgi:glycerophosphoryl diester phosphodiesterase
MSSRHPCLPQHRPLAIAHRGGNSLAEVLQAIELGADMIETDIWLHGDGLEIRHLHRKGPIYWERWRVAIGFREHLTLRELLQGTPEDALLFLDLKGDNPALGPAILAELQRTAPNRQVAICGRDYPQLDPMIDAPNVTLFYSVGEAKEWARAWPYLEAMTWPALSLKRSLATPQVMQRLKAMNATVVCWDVQTTEQLQALERIGVDGATTDSAELIRQVVAAREGNARDGSSQANLQIRRRRRVRRRDRRGRGGLPGSPAG